MVYEIIVYFVFVFNVISDISPALHVMKTDSSFLFLIWFQMCTSELYSSAPEKTSALTSQNHMSSPLPPPKKRARQWSLDNSEGSFNTESQKSDSQSKKSSKPISGNKRLEGTSGHKKSRGASKNIHSATQSIGQCSNTSLKLDKKQNDVASSQQSQSPPLHPISEAMSFPLSCQIQASSAITGQVHSIESQGEGQDLPCQHPPQSLPHPGSSTPFFYHETLGSAPEGIPRSTHQAHKDMPEHVLDFSHHSAKQVGNLKTEPLFEKKYNSLGLPLPTEGKIASLLSSSHPLAGFETSTVNADFIERKAPSSGCFTPSPQPLVNEKFGIIDSKPSSGSLASDGYVSSNVCQSFTEGKVKKKWTQRMMVEAKKEEDQARQVTCSAGTLWPPTQGPAHSTVPVSLKTSNFQPPPVDFSPNKSPFLIAKSEVKLEPSPVFSDGLSFKTSLPKDYTCHSLNASNSSSSSTNKSEALQSNTLYRALMGQTPSHFTMSTYTTKTSMTMPAPSNFSNSTFGTLPSKVEEDKKIFTPIAACGKKIMDHIVERLFQTGFSGEGKNTEQGQNVHQVELTSPNFLDDSSVRLKPPPPVKCSVVDLQTAFSLPVRSAQNLVEKLVTEVSLILFSLDYIDILANLFLLSLESDILKYYGAILVFLNPFQFFLIQSLCCLCCSQILCTFSHYIISQTSRFVVTV